MIARGSLENCFETPQGLQNGIIMICWGGRPAEETVGRPKPKTTPPSWHPQLSWSVNARSTSPLTLGLGPPYFRQRIEIVRRDQLNALPEREHALSRLQTWGCPAFRQRVELLVSSPCGWMCWNPKNKGAPSPACSLRVCWGRQNVLESTTYRTWIVEEECAGRKPSGKPNTPGNGREMKIEDEASFLPANLPPEDDFGASDGGPNPVVSTPYSTNVSGDCEGEMMPDDDSDDDSDDDEVTPRAMTRMTAISTMKTGRQMTKNEIWTQDRSSPQTRKRRHGIAGASNQATDSLFIVKTRVQESQAQMRASDYQRTHVG
ncbi:hypothetical protein THAOC_24812 [Thalassiosira oceanica]|uniref:Uncharacterized protein n=1 Tax=Thalassiosira oceanica TaxID=159749 RepID=K0RQR9_THAOC|nr:hypothetical protein THAOC_24812 [Thalassiosira oceanica]|eukprot:EJK55455.1 hypothetical protein THAOC_24812 [Thalassiosira oceanica]